MFLRIATIGRRNFAKSLDDGKARCYTRCNLDYGKKRDTQRETSKPFSSLHRDNLIHSELRRNRISRREPYRGRYPAADTTRINSEIRARDVRVIDAEGKQLGVMNLRDALTIATEKLLDLVEVAPNSNPPVCRLMDYGKYQYEKQKREREARKAQKAIEIKEVRLAPRTDDHDVQVAVNKIKKWAEEGDKVRVRIRFRGREMSHPEIAQEMLTRIANDVSAEATVEASPQFDGRTMIMVLAPAS